MPSVATSLGDVFFGDQITSLLTVYVSLKQKVLGEQTILMEGRVGRIIKIIQYCGTDWSMEAGGFLTDLVPIANRILDFLSI